MKPFPTFPTFPPPTAVLAAMLVAAAHASAAQPAPAPAAASPAASQPAPQPPVAAMAALEPRSGTNVSGKVAFVQHDGAVDVQAVVTGLPPNSEHGFHVHEKGDCSASDGSSAGGHFAPRGHPHGPQQGEHHAGDMPSLTADGSGKAILNFRMDGVTVTPGPYSVLGKAVVVHAKADDFRTQPSGDSGARVACGVVQTDHLPAQPAK